MPSESDIKKGLKGVYFDTSDASYVDGVNGVLLYRGYNIHDLAEKSTFEEIAFLLLKGYLPTFSEMNDFKSALIKNRQIPDSIKEIIKIIKDAHPMDVLRTTVSALSSFEKNINDNSIDSTIEKGMKLTSQIPTIVTAHHRIREGLSPIEPDSNLNFAANFLYMLKGERPTLEEERVMDIDFILHAEHSSNASAFAARVAASTNADLHSAIVTGIATLKGPLHGGAAQEVISMTEKVGEPENASSYIKKLIDNGEKIMGFGHRVYKAPDPRAKHLKSRSKTLGEIKGNPKWHEILIALEKAMAPYQKKGIYPNVDFFAGSIYSLLEIPEDLFVPIFAIGRVPGWTLQAIEQIKNNELIRPLLKYIGPKERKYIPIEER